jgi:4-aminobutyrate aminotransferase
VEAAVKLARMATGRRNIIVMQGSFHGRTHQTMAMTTSKYVYRYNYQPLPGGVFVTPFPYAIITAGTSGND